MKLTARNKLEKPPISFNIPQRSIKLRGVEKVIRPFKRFLEGILESLRCPNPSQTNLVTRQDLVCLRTRFHPGCTSQRWDGPKLFTLRGIEDSDLINTWHEIVVPALPGILENAVGDNYSASLVRKGLSEHSCQAVIQIQIPKMPSQAVCKEIRSQILRYIDEKFSRYRTDVEFSAGSLTLLAGDEVLDVQTYESDAETPIPEDYPYNKTYWDRPGMGASIGLLCTKMISATLGCYVHVDGDLFLLTVKHFITKSYKRLIENTTDKKTLVSPAIVEVDEMKSTLQQFIRDMNSEIGIEWRKKHGDNDSQASDLQPRSTEIENLLQLIDIAQNDLNRLEGDVGRFKLGAIAHLSDSIEQTPVIIGAAPSNAFQGHHMDWALCSVIKERAGVNRHRYRFDVDTGEVDYCAEGSDELGSGLPCQETCQVEPNEQVHFVGQTTGRQRAEISATKMLVSCNKVKTLEWVLIPKGEQTNSKKYGGASGASIIRDRDNKIVGHLWACTKKGLLVFTPINHVFQDIKKKLNAEVVCLAPISTGHGSSPSPLINEEDENEVREICRDKEEESPQKQKTYRKSSMQLPKAQPKAHDTPRDPEPQASAIAPVSPLTTTAATRDASTVQSTLPPTRALSASPLATGRIPLVPRHPTWPKQGSFAEKQSRYFLHLTVTEWPAGRPLPLQRRLLMLQRSANTWPIKKPSLVNQRPLTVS